MCFFYKGDLIPSTMTHVVTLKDCIIIVKNVLREACKECGETYFNDATMAKLKNIVNTAKTIASEISVIDFMHMA